MLHMFFLIFKSNPMVHTTGEEVDSAGGPRPLCLFSKPVSHTHFAKYCRNQLVGFTYRDTFDTGAESMLYLKLKSMLYLILYLRVLNTS